ncbi:hypothetical protein DXU77_10585 [Pseudomonas lactis]|nr:hypothetical protein [Pseudomonas lactis]
MLARNSQAPRSIRKHAFSLTFFASKLAPTRHGSGGLGRHKVFYFSIRHLRPIITSEGNFQSKILLLFLPKNPSALPL